MTQQKSTFGNTVAWVLSLAFHGVLAIVVLRAGYKIAFPEGSVEMVQIETYGNMNAPENSAPPKVKSEPKTKSELAPLASKSKLKFIPDKPAEVVRAAPQVEDQDADVPAKAAPEANAESTQEETVKSESEIKNEEAPADKNSPEPVAAQEAAGTQSESNEENHPEFGTPGTMLDVTRLSEQPGNRKPSYPWMARLRRQQGTVVIKAYVKKDGTLDSVELYQSSGSALIDKEALGAYARWKYHPGSEGWVLKPFKFSLEEAAK